MFEEGKETPSETLFAGAVPVSMVKQILKEKKLLNEGYNKLKFNYVFYIEIIDS